MIGELFSATLSFLFWPLIIGLILWWRRGRRPHPSRDREWYLRLALSREEAVSDFFLVLSLLFLGLTLFSFNRDFGDPLSWRTLVLLTSLTGFIGAYLLRTPHLLLFSLVGLTVWWTAQAAEWRQGGGGAIASSALTTGLSFLALLFYAVGQLHGKEEKFKRFALIYGLLGVLMVIGMLFILSTKPGLAFLETMTTGKSFLRSAGLTVSLLLFAAALVGATISALSRNVLYPIEAAAVFILAVLFGVTVFLPPQRVFAGSAAFVLEGKLSGTGAFWAILYNLALFLTILGFTFSGAARREVWRINLGAVFLFLLIVVKYIDWFFTFLNKSVFFVGAGLILLAVGWFLEKGRRYLLANIGVQEKH